MSDNCTTKKYPKETFRPNETVRGIISTMMLKGAYNSKGALFNDLIAKGYKKECLSVNDIVRQSDKRIFDRVLTTFDGDAVGAVGYMIDHFMQDYRAREKSARDGMHK